MEIFTIKPMQRLTARLALAFAIGIALTSHSAAQEPLRQDPEAMFDAGQSDYERSNWRKAFDAFAELADHGHAESARIALLMAHFGKALYGEEFNVNRARIEAWVDVASRAPVTSSSKARRDVDPVINGSVHLEPVVERTATAQR